MKVLHVNFSDTMGGASRAACRIHNGLLKVGVDSRMLVAHKGSGDDRVLVRPLRFFTRKLRYAHKIAGLQKSSSPVIRSINFFSTGLHKEINRSSADIVNFHWVHNEMISIAEIARIKKPIVWTLHDMWAFSGAEHYEDMGNPGRCKQGYSRKTRDPEDKGPDIDEWVWRRKQKHLQNKAISFVAPSHWMADRLSESVLFSRHTVQVIPNCLDTALFVPADQASSRKRHNLPLNKKLILFGADYCTINMRKGHDLLGKALYELSERKDGEEYEAVVFGAEHSNPGESFTMKTHYVGRITDDTLLSQLYSAADVFVAPSRQDNLPNTIMEALACGIPCVSFRVGGVPDLIDHKKNGFLAQPYESKSLAQGIEWVLEDAKDHRELKNTARIKVEHSFAPSIVGRQYRYFYEKVLLKEDV